jgi:hypothetical protein
MSVQISEIVRATNFKPISKMKVYSEITLMQFEAWSGAKQTQLAIIKEGLSEAFDSLIEELYPDGIDETKLNDILWFDADWVYESLGMEIDED